MASELKPWRYEIKYGPEGEDAYSWVYDDHGAMVATMKTHKAREVVDRMNTPVAPVSPDATGKCGELVTVGEVSTVRESIAAFAGHMLSRQLKPGDLLVTRSQAEELLAAEQAMVRHWQEQYTEMHSQFIDLAKSAEADNAAKDAAYKRLEQQAIKNRHLRDEAQSDADLWRFSVDMGDHPTLLVKVWKQRKALEAKLTAAQEALRTARDYLVSELADEKVAFKGYEQSSHISDIENDIAAIDAALGGKPS